ncbi:hypothetical protein GCM10012287_35810 [Streptomyces daqingensis]|jgi:hypothetical protein|uniref:Secreted protein n=1 Tax=Streptomyces daqingensis TaxID=1472640 RepID=A0ABQ2MGK9_9ACTN|nr:hypothetical protein [Streptomyces daqingensis]GGO52149.1 hypothetical protein GCM10012287_35810 [Streptomyces daqingensis]
MSITTKIRRKTVVRSATALAVGMLVAGGLAVNASAGETPAKEHRSNAQILDEKCAVPPNHDPAIINTVHDVATQRGVTEKVMLAAFEAGWVESHMHNLNCGDRDSLGVFQQRPSAGWGTPEQILDPVYATNAFLDQAIPNDANNPGFTAGELAQSVQRSAFPERYDQAEGKAREMIAEAAGS